MRISDKIRNNWKLLMEHGDIEKICQFSKTKENPEGITRTTIGNAIRTSRMNEKTFEVVQGYFKKKKQDQATFERKHAEVFEDGN